MPDKPLKPASLSRADWFGFRDRDHYSPQAGSTVTTHGFIHRTAGGQTSSDWEQEEWSFHSCLVPLDGKYGLKASEIVAGSVGAHDIDFTPWWQSAHQFDFGAVRYVAGAAVRPLIHTRVHRLTRALIIEPTADLIRYHAADTKPSTTWPGGLDYIHPLDDSVVLRTAAKSIAHYDATAFVEAHRDYLLDYLAARRAALVIAIVADRFANAPSVEELELEPSDYVASGRFATTKNTVHPQSPFNRGIAMGRTSLFWNIVVTGYRRPKRARNPWHFHDQERHDAGDNQPPPTFIADAEGGRLTAAASPAYLYFGRRVLEKYFATPGYRAGFHMRTWGFAYSPSGSIDVGINSCGLVNAFMPDIAKLPTSEQNHWSSHSVLPDGEICWAMFETRMQQRPPHQPGVVDLVSGALARLRDAALVRFGVLIRKDDSDLPESSGRMSVGPLGSNMEEVGSLAVALHVWVTEGMSINTLRDALAKSGLTPDRDARQLGLLRALISQAGGCSSAEARRIVGPLDALNELRAKAAHLAAIDYNACMGRLGLAAMPVGTRQAWAVLVDTVVASLDEMASIFRAEPNR